MRFRFTKFARAALAATVALLLAVAPARAQDDDGAPFREPGISYMQYQKPYLPWVAGTLIIVACLFIAFKNPHRSHLD